MLSALELARLVEAGSLTPADVLERCAQAITAREKDVGAFTVLDLDHARETATREATTLSARPLRGLPVGFKDIFDTADFPTAYGSAIYAGHRPRADAALVAMARRAGANIVGKTVSTEMAFLDPAATRNPRNLAHTPGGSSSGSAAAVAAGMLPIAFGTQTGGSVIRPAAYCGVTGFKPSYRLLPMVGVKCFSWSLDTAGLFAASVADAAFAAAAITGRDLRIDGLDSGAPRIGLVRMHIDDEASPDMLRAVETAARAAEKHGARVTEVVLPPLLAQAWNIHGTIQNYEAARALAFEYDHHRAQMSKFLGTLLDQAAAITADAYDDARRISKRARQAFGEIMSEFDVMLAPAATGAAPRGLASTGDPRFNRLWTLLGAPCVNIAGLSDGHGLPLGVQAIGRFGRDRTMLEAAHFVERALSASH